MSMDMTPDVLAVDYVGEPGKRTFFLQARKQSRIFTFEIEKQQVALMAEKLREMLLLVDGSDRVVSAGSARNGSLVLVAPIEPEWRVGTIGLAYEEPGDVVVVVLQPMVTADLDQPEPLEEQETEARLLLGREQVRDFVLHAEAVVAEGRPLCQLCGLPIDPDGHVCPASNGHRLGSDG